MAKKYFWFKMKDDFFNTKEIKKLRRIAGGDTLTIIYLKLILLSVREEGKLYYDSVEDTFAKELAMMIDEEEENVELALSFMIKHNLVDVMGDSELVVTHAVKHIGTESESAERVRNHRARKEQLALQCNGQVTNCNTELKLDLEQKQELNITSQKIRLFSECYKGAFEKEYRKVKKDIDWNPMLDGIGDCEFIDLVYEFFNDDRNEGKYTIEYFNTVCDRYR